MLSPDGTGVYALRGRQVIRMEVADGRDMPVGVPADGDNAAWFSPTAPCSALSRMIDAPRRALLAPDGERTGLRPAADAEKLKRNGALPQEGRDYADGTRLEVQELGAWRAWGATCS